MSFLLSILLLGVGFLIGNITPKIKIERMDGVKKNNHANKKGRSFPPPPPIRAANKKGHIKPGETYNSDTFVNINECNDCGAIAREYDMYTTSPCPSCGGSVERSGAAKWGIADGVKQWIRAEHKRPV